MGSPLRLSVPDMPDGADAWQLVVDEFEAAEAALSRFRESSELTLVNKRAGSGQAVLVSSRLRIALVAAERARRVTGGRFDPRVLDDLDQLGYRGAPLGVESTSARHAIPRGPAGMRSTRPVPSRPIPASAHVRVTPLMPVLQASATSGSIPHRKPAHNSANCA